MTHPLVSKHREKINAMIVHGNKVVILHNKDTDHSELYVNDVKLIEAKTGGSCNDVMRLSLDTYDMQVEIPILSWSSELPIGMALAQIDPSSEKKVAIPRVEVKIPAHQLAPGQEPITVEHESTVVDEVKACAGEVIVALKKKNFTSKIDLFHMENKRCFLFFECKSKKSVLMQCTVKAFWQNAKLSPDVLPPLLQTCIDTYDMNTQFPILFLTSVGFSVIVVAR